MVRARATVVSRLGGKVELLANAWKHDKGLMLRMRQGIDREW